MGLEASLRWARRARMRARRAGARLRRQRGRVQGGRALRDHCASACCRRRSTNVVRHAAAEAGAHRPVGRGRPPGPEIADDGRGLRPRARAPARMLEGASVNMPRHGGARAALIGGEVRIDATRPARAPASRSACPLYRTRRRGTGFGHGRNASSAGGRSRPGARGHPLALGGSIAGVAGIEGRRLAVRAVALAATMQPTRC